MMVVARIEDKDGRKRPLCQCVCVRVCVLSGLAFRASIMCMCVCCLV